MKAVILAGGVHEFIVALGYRAEVVKEYFLNFYALNNNISVDLTSGGTKVHRGNAPAWKLDLVDTGLITQTGGRIKRIGEWLGSDQTWINGGFLVLNRKVLEYIDGDDTLWEREPMERLAEDGQLMAYRHEGFWQPMDTLREKRLLEDLWASGKAPWKIW